MNSLHLHLIMNHFPIMMMVLAIGVLIAGMLLQQKGWQKAALWLCVLTALSTIPVFLLGLRAEDIAERLVDTPSMKYYLEGHEHFAIKTLIGALVLGALAGITLWRFRSSQDSAKWLTLVLVVACVQMGMFAIAASLGAQIGHVEIRQDWVSRSVASWFGESEHSDDSDEASHSEAPKPSEGIGEAGH